MSLVINANERCKFADTCPYNNQNAQNFCTGADSNRSNSFVCDFVNESGMFSDGKFRSKYDLTGKMKIIVEQK